MGQVVFYGIMVEACQSDRGDLGALSAETLRDFHAAVYIKNLEDLTGLNQNVARQVAHVGENLFPSDSRGDLSGLKPPSQYFSNFLNAYARGVNIAVQRTGPLFERPFKRIPVDSESYFMRLITEGMHQNPQKHGFVPDFRD